jgi:hypothetical protein
VPHRSASVSRSPSSPAVCRASNSRFSASSRRASAASWAGDAGFDVRLAGTAVKVIRRGELVARVDD